jgi:hypothetical protein
VYAIEMQRIFTMFPAGMPGLALLLMRTAVAGSVWQPAMERGLPGVTHLLGLGVLSVVLLAGFATPFASALVAAIQFERIAASWGLGIWINSPVVTAALHGASALSLALLGPGALSVDARLFGRRVLTSS